MRLNDSEDTYSTVTLSRISRGSENHPTRPGLRCWTTMPREEPAVAWLRSFMLCLNGDYIFGGAVRMMGREHC